MHSSAYAELLCEKKNKHKQTSSDLTELYKNVSLVVSFWYNNFLCSQQDCYPQSEYKLALKSHFGELWTQVLVLWSLSKGCNFSFQDRSATIF